MNGITADTHVAARSRSPPPEGRVNLGTLFFAVFGGPIAWFVQLVVNYALGSHPCLSQSAPRSDFLPGWDWVSSAVLMINLVATAVALAAAMVSLRLWVAGGDDHPPIDNEFLPPLAGRTRFLAISGILTGFGFMAATIFDLVALLTVPTCPG